MSSRYLSLCMEEIYKWQTDRQTWKTDKPFFSRKKMIDQWIPATDPGTTNTPKNVKNCFPKKTSSVNNCTISQNLMILLSRPVGGWVTLRKTEVEIQIYVPCWIVEPLSLNQSRREKVNKFYKEKTVEHFLFIKMTKFWEMKKLLSDLLSQ